MRRDMVPSERRFLFLLALNTLVGNAEYFNELYTLIADLEVMRAVYKVFKTMAIPAALGNPVTSATKKLIIKSHEEGYITFLRWMVSKGYVCDQVWNSELKDYLDEFNRLNKKLAMSSASLSTKLGMAMYSGKIQGIRRSAGAIYKGVGMPNERCWYFDESFIEKYSKDDEFENAIDALVGAVVLPAVVSPAVVPPAVATPAVGEESIRTKQTHSERFGTDDNCL